MTERMILGMIAGVVLVVCIASMAKCTTPYMKDSWKDTCIRAGYEVIDGKSCKKSKFKQ